MAKRLVDVVLDSDAFEPHPTSGEIEIGTIEPITYRRLDEETFQARLPTLETRLEVTFLWCQTEEEERGGIWRIAEVKPFSDSQNKTGEEWYPSIDAAEDAERYQLFGDAVWRDCDAPSQESNKGGVSTDDVDEDDYWAQYDKTPGRTPKPGHSPAPTQQNRHARTASEAEYFARYAQVQPEMDNDDSSQDKPDIGESTLNGHILISSDREAAHVPRSGEDESLEQATASSPNRGSAISRMEEVVDTQSVAITAVRQHVSANLKSLFKLCRSIGLDTAEFVELVTTEMQALKLLDIAH